jgi:trimeric autotransporter adhesin
MHGGDGNDQIGGSDGNDALYGDKGEDDLQGNEGIDLCDGGLDTDYNVIEHTQSCETVINIP